MTEETWNASGKCQKYKLLISMLINWNAAGHITFALLEATFQTLAVLTSSAKDFLKMLDTFPKLWIKNQISYNAGV